MMNNNFNYYEVNISKLIDDVAIECEIYAEEHKYDRDFLEPHLKHQRRSKNLATKSGKKYVDTILVNCQPILDNPEDYQEYEDLDREELRERIINSIKANAPTKIKDEIYFLPDNDYYFCTDKGAVFNLRQVPSNWSALQTRLYQQHRKAVDEIKKVIDENIAKVKPLILVHHDAYFKMLEEKEWDSIKIAKYKEVIDKVLEWHQISEDEAMQSADTIPVLCCRPYSYSVYNQIEFFVRNYVSYLDNKLELRDERNKIHESCEQTPNYVIHELKPDGSTISIYCGKKFADRWSYLGYKPTHVSRDVNARVWDDIKGQYIYTIITKEMHRIRINLKTFVSMCKFHRHIHPHQVITDEGETITRENNTSAKEVTILGPDGVERKFVSSRLAAEYYNVNPMVINRYIKKYEGKELKPLTIPKAKNKGISLYTETLRLIKFDTLTRAAEYIGVNKMALSRAIKGKDKGQDITLNGQVFYLA